MLPKIWDGKENFPESERKFFEKSGFEVVSLSEKDGAGMNYPILHMGLKQIL